MATHIIPEGTSEPQDFALLDAGEAIDGTSIDVALEIAKHPDEEVNDPPSVEWLNRAGGTVRVTGTESLTVGLYYVRFKLTDTAGKVGFVPNGRDPLKWRVVPVPEQPST